MLSTCNRMEMYVVGLSWHRGVREIEEWMSVMSGVPLEELRPYLFLKRDRDATWHLLRVASGLDSLVMGEGQILAQVKAVRSCRPLPLSVDRPRALDTAVWRSALPALRWRAYL